MHRGDGAVRKLDVGQEALVAPDQPAGQKGLGKMSCPTLAARVGRFNVPRTHPHSRCGPARGKFAGRGSGKPGAHFMLVTHYSNRPTRHERSVDARLRTMAGAAPRRRFFRCEPRHIEVT